MRSGVAVGLGISMHIDQEITSRCIGSIAATIFGQIHLNCSYYGNAAAGLIDGHFVRCGQIILAFFGGREEDVAE